MSVNAPSPTTHCHLLPIAGANDIGLHYAASYDGQIHCFGSVDFTAAAALKNGRDVFVSMIDEPIVGAG